MRLMVFNFKQTVCWNQIILIFPFITSQKSLFTRKPHATFVKAQISWALSMLQWYHLTWENKSILELLFILPITNYLPLIKVLRHICFKLLIDFIWINSPLWRRWPKLTLFVLSLNLFRNELFTDMQVRIVLLVVQQNVIIIDDSLSVLSILVTRMDLVGNTLSWRLRDKFDLLASTIGLRYLLGKLEVVQRIGMLKLNRLTVEYSLSPHFLNQFIVVIISGLHSLF